MSEVTPRANKKYCTVTPPSACLPPSAVVSVGEKAVVVVGTSKEEKKGKGWMVSPASWLLKGERKKKEQEVVKSQAKGTGYSSYQSKGWVATALVLVEMAGIGNQLETVLTA